MQIIVVPTDARHKTRCLDPKKAFFILLILAVLVPVGLAVGAYSYGVMQNPIVVSPEQLKLRDVKLAVDNRRQELEEAQRGVERQLDTFGQRIGQMQAQISRINAMGQRLTDMAGLEADEFNFDVEPAVGGREPESVVVKGEEATHDLIVTLNVLEKQIVVKQDELEVLETLLMDRELHTEQFPQGWPVPGGWMSSSYGYRTDPFTGRRAFHSGVDIATKLGAPITAVASGVVTFSGVKPGFGLMVEINHGNGYVTRYAHALARMVETGDRIEKGEIVAVVGSTGRSTGAHLHFELLRNDKAVNPRRYLRASS